MRNPEHKSIINSYDNTIKHLMQCFINEPTNVNRLNLIEESYENNENLFVPQVSIFKRVGVRGEFEEVLKYTYKNNFNLCIITDKLTDLNYGFLQCLILNNNNITDSQLLEILKFLPRTVSTLALHKNKIANQGVKAICNTVEEKNICLSKLNLSYNNISERGAFDLAFLLTIAPITHLILAHNNIGDEGAEKLLKAVFPQIKRIDLLKNNISKEFESNYFKELKETKAIQI